MHAMSRVFVGIDPGKRGAIVAIRGGSVVLAERLPWLGKAGMDLASVAAILRSVYGAATVVERAHAMPGQGVASMFRYGEGYGALQGVLAALGMPYVTAPPRTWQRAIYGTLAKGAKPKPYAIQACRQRLPDLDLTPGQVRKPHDGLADAGCLALYAAQVWR